MPPSLAACGQSFLISRLLLFTTDPATGPVFKAPGAGQTTQSIRAPHLMTSSHPAPTARIVLCIVVIVGALYGWSMLDRGWVPHDEGAFGLSAERVLGGEVPHRDFDDLYTGGLTYLNALSFEVFGHRLISLRYTLYFFYIGWIAIFYWISTRLAGAWAAGVVSLLAIVWSIPNYPAAVPSWYNLFFATAGVAALARYLETDRRAWIFWAGVAAGISLLFKIAGLYFAAGCLLFLAWHAQVLSAALRRGGGSERVPWYPAMVCAAAGLVVLLLLRVLGPRLEAAEIVHFVLPGAFIAGVVIRGELRLRHASSAPRFAIAYRLVAPFLMGMAIPVLSFLLWYASNDALASLWHGLVLQPRERLRFAAMRPFGLIMLLPSVWLAAALVLERRGRRVSQLLAALVFIVGLWSLRRSGTDQLAYMLPWLAISQAIPVAVLFASAALSEEPREATPNALRRALLMLLASTLALCTLVQFPFTAPIYFAYVAPLLFLTIAAFRSLREDTARPVVALLAGFYLAFPILRVTPGFIYHMGRHAAANAYTKPFRLQGGAFRVRPSEDSIYSAIDDLLRAHATGAYIYAGPDSPEVYFLSGFRNPTRSLFDFFDARMRDREYLMRIIGEKEITAVVVNREPAFSQVLPADMVSALTDRFPHDSTVGQFTVRWR